MKRNETQLYDRKAFLSTLMKMEHGKLEGYVAQGMQAQAAEPDLFGHFIAWNEINGKVRDSKVAYPVIALRGSSDQELLDNAVSHLMLLSPRDLVRSYEFSKQLTQMGHPISKPGRERYKFGMNEYLYVRERKQGWWDRTALQHRDSLRRLYRITHRAPVNHVIGDRPQKVLFEGDYPAGSIFARVAGLRTMTPREAASVILTNRIPFEVLTGAMDNIKHQDVLLAILEGMTGNQVVTNTKMLERLGVMNDPVLKSAYDNALAKARTDKKLNVLKAGVAAEHSRSSAQSLQALQSDATKKQLSGVEGNWLVLGDRSGSMSASMELAKKVASLITEQVKGKVWLVFFNSYATAFDVTGKSFFQINEMTKHIRAEGGTSIGIGLDWLMAQGHEVDGIAIVSDGGDNTTPYFRDTYIKYAKKIDKEPTVYHFRVDGDPNVLVDRDIQIETFNMQKVDYYSLPNIISTLRTNRYSLVDEIMATPLLTLQMALYGKEEDNG